MVSSQLYAGEAPFVRANETGTKISIWIPGFLLKLGLNFIDEEDETARYFLKKIRGVNIKVVEGSFYHDGYEAKAERAIDLHSGKSKMKPLITVITPEEKVAVFIKRNKKGTIRKIQVIVLAEDLYVNVRIGCNFKLPEVMDLIKGQDFKQLKVPVLS